MNVLNVSQSDMHIDFDFAGPFFCVPDREFGISFSDLQNIGYRSQLFVLLPTIPCR